MTEFELRKLVKLCWILHENLLLNHHVGNPSHQITQQDASVQATKRRDTFDIPAVGRMYPGVWPVGSPDQPIRARAHEIAHKLRDTQLIDNAQTIRTREFHPDATSVQ